MGDEPGDANRESPAAVMRAAHALGAELFDEHSQAFSRRDFTLPQLFAARCSASTSSVRTLQRKVRLWGLPDASYTANGPE